AQAQAEGAQARALAGLAQVLGVDPATPIVLAPGPLAPQRIEDRELAQWLRDARQRHPAIKAAQAGLAAATAQVDVARATDMPTVDLSLGHYRNSSENVSVFAGSSRSVSASLNLRIPLFDGFARRHRIQGARAEVQRQEALLDQARLATGAAVARAYA
ncbi:cyclolysin secretion protein CyaE, partial [Bordetella pertussis]